MDNIEQIKVNGTSYKVRSDLDEKINNLGLKIYDADNDETYNLELRVENGKPVLSYTAPPTSTV